MPQDIPLEASETLAFTPDCLTGLVSPPVFMLRTATTREKRWRRRLMNEEAAVQHSVEALRAEMLNGLRELWGEKAYAQHAPIVEAFWNASDDFALQRKDDPDLKWEYDPEIEAAVNRLEDDVAQAYKAFAKMRADNTYAAEVAMLSVPAVMVLNWTGLPVQPSRERGYLTIDSIEKMHEKLGDLEEDNAMKRGLAWAQLLAACTRRLFLDEDEEKNSESPLPSETPPPSSKPNKGRGKSPAAASSPSTPDTV